MVSSCCSATASRLRRVVILRKQILRRIPGANYSLERSFGMSYDRARANFAKKFSAHDRTGRNKLVADQPEHYRNTDAALEAAP